MITFKRPFQAALVGAFFVNATRSLSELVHLAVPSMQFLNMTRVSGLILKMVRHWSEGPSVSCPKKEAGVIGSWKGGTHHTQHTQHTRLRVPSKNKYARTLPLKVEHASMWDSTRNCNNNFTLK